MYANTVSIAALFSVALVSTAIAQPPPERGSYLVNTIMACGNCHTPKDSAGMPIAEKELSGGLSTTPAFNATAPNITPDKESGIGGWSDADIGHALVNGVRPQHRAPSRRAACSGYAGSILQSASSEGP